MKADAHFTIPCSGRIHFFYNYNINNTYFGVIWLHECEFSLVSKCLTMFSEATSDHRLSINAAPVIAMGDAKFRTYLFP